MLSTGCSINFVGPVGYDIEDGQMIYRSAKTNDPEFIGTLEDVDLGGFEVIEDYPEFGYDASHVYGRSSILDGVDPTTFSILKEENDYIYYAEDKNGSYEIHCKLSTCVSQKIYLPGMNQF